MPYRARCLLTLVLGLAASCSNDELLPIRIELGGRTVSKLPFVIAEEYGLYRKYGLKAEIRLPPPRAEGQRATHDTGLSSSIREYLESAFSRADPWTPDVFVDGHTPNIVKLVERADHPHYVAIAGIDCVLRAHVIAQPQFESLEQLKGRRIGISGRVDTTTGFGALKLAERMGWNPRTDISIKYEGRNVEDLAEDRVDAIIASETRYAKALKANFRILADTAEWGWAVGGNSAMVKKGWLDDAPNREAARRLLKALTHALAIYHQDRDAAVTTMKKWYGISDPDEAAAIYDRGRLLEKTPFPCVDGVQNTFDTYDSNEMRNYSPDDFYDRSIVDELVRDGFVDRVFADPTI